MIMNLQAAFEKPFRIKVLGDSRGLSSSAQGSTSTTNSSQTGPVEAFDSELPAVYRIGDDLEIPSVESAYFSQQLSVARLEQVYNYLWIAGRPMPARPLHYQIAAGRTIVVVEQMDLHLVWAPGRMFLKPIPRYLLNPDFWDQHLVCQPNIICPCFQRTQSNEAKEGNQRSALEDENEVRCERHKLYQTALGYLLSYAALIQYESDFRMAQARFLIPSTIEWIDWRTFTKQLLEKRDKSIGKRFRFGELRLSRLNMIYRLCRCSIRGYRFEFQDYPSFIRTHLTPIITYLAFITIILTAMQVGLATNQLKDSSRFHSASYGFTVFSIASPIGLLFAITCAVLVLFTSNFISTRKFMRKRLRVYEKKQSRG